MFVKFWQPVCPWVGMLRIYSLVDLIVMLYAVRLDAWRITGAVLMWIAFLILLEAKHQHRYRPKVSAWLCLLPAAVGYWFFAQPVSSIGFTVFSILYTLKDGKLGQVSNVFRAFQVFFLLSASQASGFLVSAACVGTGLRNFVADLGDLAKDQNQGMLTLPIVMGFRQSIHRDWHLLCVSVMSVGWWFMTSLNFYWLFVILATEMATYQLTPRKATYLQVERAQLPS